MNTFCTRCGSRLDPSTGLCPNCDTKPVETAHVTQQNCLATPECEYCGSKINIQTGTCSNPLCGTFAPQEAPAPVYPPQESFGNTPPVKEEKPKKEKKVKPPRSKGAKITISILLTICLCITAFASLMIFDVRNTVKEDNLTELFEDVEIDVDEILCDFDIDGSDTVYKLYRNLEWNYGATITNKKVTKFIESSTLKEFFIEKVADFCEDFFDGKGAITLSNYEIYRLLYNNRNKIEDVFNFYPDSEELQKIANIIYDGEEEMVLVDTAIVKREESGIYYGASIGLSYGTMIAFLLLTALIIFALLRNDLSQGSACIGVLFTVIGTPFVLGWLVSAVYPSLWEVVCDSSFIGTMVKNFFEINCIASFVVFGVGVITLAVRTLVKRSKKSQ